MNPHPHIQGSELLLYHRVGGAKIMDPTPTNKVANSHFTMGGRGQNNEPPPPQTR